MPIQIKLLANESQADFDRRVMRRALTIAKRGEGRVEPNPMVGCVIAMRGHTIAEGYHRRFGGDHAEVVALARCEHNARGATAYVTLEPCNYQGKTPPCTDALLNARVGRVVVATRDPNPLVAGRGIRKLRRAGVAVDVGCCADQSRELLAPYATRLGHERPYVIAKWAQSLDGNWATHTGDSRWISSPPSRRLVHRLRGRVDGILVGSGTVLADDPLLTARDVPVRRRATRIVLDGRLRIPLSAQLVTGARQTATLVFTTRERAVSTKAKRLAARGVDVVAIPTRGAKLVLKDALRRLADRGMTNVLVEGGATLLGGLMDADLVDETWMFVAPMLIGGGDRAPSLRLAKRIAAIDAGRKGRLVSCVRSGADAWVRVRLMDAPGARAR